MADKARRSAGMTAFTIIWVGQILSLLGTAVGQFDASLGFRCQRGPGNANDTHRVLLLCPDGGVYPRWRACGPGESPKLMMMLSDLAAALTTLFVLILFATGHLQVWHLYITAFITGTFQGFRWPAYSAAITTMLDEGQQGERNARNSRECIRGVCPTHRRCTHWAAGTMDDAHVCWPLADRIR